MPNSAVYLQEIIDEAGTLGDTAPALATGGFANTVALSIGTDVMQAIVNGGPMGQPYNWKWNRFNVPAFPTISYQQDYFVPGVVQVGWLEHAWASNVNQTQVNKQKVPLEVRKDLDVTYEQTGYPGRICWLPNDQMQTGTWGAAPQGPTAGAPYGQQSAVGANPSGLQNPGPNVVYTNPIGSVQAPVNATTCLTDPNGNLWVLTTFGTCGATQPTWPTNPTYPTPANPTATATTVTDGTCVWTAVNPKGQGFRLSPLPPQTGIVWLIQPVAQKKAPRFTSVKQTLEPLPDDYALYFKQGFFAECYRRSPDPKVRAKYPSERQMFLEALDKAVRQADRETDDYGFTPDSTLLSGGGAGYGGNSIAYPYGRGW